MNLTRRSRPARLFAVATVALLASTLAACGDDDDQSTAEDEFCDQVAQLRDEVTDLTDLDVVTDREAFDDQLAEVSDQVDEVRGAADAAARADLDELEDALDEADASFDALADDPNLDDAGAAISAIGDALGAGLSAAGTLAEAC